MNGSSPRERLRLISNASNPLKLELANHFSTAEHALVKNAHNTFTSIGDGFTDSTALALYDAKALSDVPQFAKDFLKESQDLIPENFYTNISGERSLIKTLSLQAKKKNIYYSEPENILVTAGAVNAFYCLCQSLCNQGDIILTLSPSYILFANAVRSFGAELVLAPSTRKDGKFSVDPNSLNQQIKSIKKSGRKIKALLIVNPTNIDSQCWTTNDIQNLVPVLSQYNFPIIEDRVYDGLQYDAPENASFFAVHPALAHRTITIDSVSKRYGATQWRIGWIYGPTNLIDRARDAVMQTVWSPNAKHQRTTALMILSGLDKETRNLAKYDAELFPLATRAETLAANYKEYFNTLRENYIKRRDFALYLIYGAEKYKQLPWQFLTKEDDLKDQYQDIISKCSSLNSGVVGFTAPVLPQAGMFLLIKGSEDIFAKLSGFAYPDLIFSRLLYKEANVVMLPPTELTLPLNERMFRIEFGVELNVLIQSLKNISLFTKKFLDFSETEINTLIDKHFIDRTDILERAQVLPVSQLDSLQI